MKVGIIGQPGSGKSTLFQLLSLKFGEPEVSRTPNKPRLERVNVLDARLERLREDFAPKKYTPAQLDVLDFPAVQKEGQDRAGIADLLAPAREAQALLIMVRAFRNSSVVGGDTVQPVDELAEVRGELILSDLEIVERRLEKLVAKQKKPNFSDAEKKELPLLEQIRSHLEAEESLATLDLSEDQKRSLAGFGFLSSKPSVVIVNTDEPKADPELVAACREAADGELLVFPVRSEVDILELPEEERADFLEEYGLEEFHRDDLIAAAYRAAGAISFFTAGEKEVRAWTIRDGSTAPQAAGAIHTDFERGFIRAEVVSYDDYVAKGGVKGSKEAGVYRLEGKEYIVKDGDIVEFRFSV